MSPVYNQIYRREEVPNANGFDDAVREALTELYARLTAPDNGCSVHPQCYPDYIKNRAEFTFMLYHILFTKMDEEDCLGMLTELCLGGTYLYETASRPDQELQVLGAVTCPVVTLPTCSQVIRAQKGCWDRLKDLLQRVEGLYIPTTPLSRYVGFDIHLRNDNPSELPSVMETEDERKEEARNALSALVSKYGSQTITDAFSELKIGAVSSSYTEGG